MKKILLITLLVLGMCGSAWGADETFYVNASQPDDAGAGTSWATAKKTWDAGLGLANDTDGGADSDTIYVAPGTYSADILLNDDDYANLTVIGVSASGSTTVAGDSVVIFDHVGYNLRIDRAGITVRGLTFTGTDASHDSVYLNAADATISQCYGHDSGRKFFWITSSGTNHDISRCYFESCADAAVKNYGTGTISTSIFTSGSSELGGTAGSIESVNAAGVCNYTNVDVIGSRNQAVTHIAAGTANITNCTFQSGDSATAAGVVRRTAGTVNVSNSLLIPNWKQPTTIFSGTINTDSNNIKEYSPKFVGHPRSGYIIPCVDDTGNFAYAEAVAEKLSARGLKGTFYVNTRNLVANLSDVQSVYNTGAMELGLHAHSNADLGETGNIYEIDTPAGQTVDVDRAGDQIIITGVDTVTGFKAKTLAAIKTELEGFGCTVGAVPGTLDGYTLGECMADSSGAQAEPYTPQLLINTDNSEGLFKTEIADAKTIFEAQLSLTAYTFAPPMGSSSDDCQTAVQNAGLLCSRNGATSETDAEWDLSEIDLYELSYVGTGSLIGADDAETVRNVRFICEAVASNGMIMAFTGHNTGEISYAEWDLILNTIAEYSTITVTSMYDAVNTIKTGGDWSTGDNRTYTKTTWPDIANLHLLAGAPGIDAGTDTPYSSAVPDLDGANMTDASGDALGAGVEIGPYNFAGYGADGATQNALALGL